METEEIQDQQQQQPCNKFSRISNSSRSLNGVVLELEDAGVGGGDELKRAASGGGGGGGGAGIVSEANNRLRGWHHSSRIIRVSRASGGKDRHSKVWTSKGLRDRRVRLSVTTAIQFYDLQDRLGYDQPSKAVEWLIRKAADAISELPSLNTPFPDTPNQDTDHGSRALDEHPFDSEQNYGVNPSQQRLSLSKSACSSTSENSKGSNLSLSKPDSRVQRVKARERARERTAKEKEMAAHHVNPISQNANSFTELLTCGIGNNAASNSPSSSISMHQTGNEDEGNFFHKAAGGRNHQWPPSAPLDYFTSGLLGPSSSRTHHSFSWLGNSLSQSMSVSPFNQVAVNGAAHHENHQSDQLQHFSLVPDHFIPAVSSQQQTGGGGGSGEYNLNFSISSSGDLTGFNRGTLQSNSPPFLPHVQRFQSVDATSHVPFFIGTAAQSTDNNNDHHHSQFPSGLQLYYADGGGGRHSDHKGKGKN